MKLLRRSLPSTAELASLRRELAGEDLSYPVGILDRSPPDGMRRHGLDVIIGSGEDDYRRATAAIDSWQPFALGWAGIFAGQSGPEDGLDVVVHAALVGLHAVVGCRVVGTHDLVAPESVAYGFTYGSLHSHIEIGEERFEVAMDTSGQVRYRIDVVAKPGRWYARVGLPVVEHYRRRFRRDSAAAMRRVLASG